MNVDTIKNFFGQGKKMQFADHRDIVRGLGADSIVLLKNNKLLPINKGKIALFGAGAVDTLFHGIFYNNVCTDKNVSVCEGLVNNGFTITTGSWLAKMEKAVKQQRIESKQKDTFEECIGITPEVSISAADLAESVLGTKTCIYVIRHGITAKNTDDYYQLTEVEQSNIKIVAETFENVILVLNSSMLEISQVARMKNVKAILYMGVPGMEAGNSLADVLTGAVNPSGHLTCTWAKKYKDYSTCYSPAIISKSEKTKEIDYKEGIYVGYRYFDTFDVAPLYPFGYGLSYTTFDMELEYLEASWMAVVLRVKVTNTGNHAGREVVQVYCSQPKGKIEKPYQLLVGFAKTGKLKPGEFEELTIKIPIMSFCSFDVESPAWVMEKGDYLLRIGNNSRDTKISGKVVLDRMTIIKRITEGITLKKNLEFLTPPPAKEEETGYILVASLSCDDYNTEKKFVEVKTEVVTYLPEGSSYASYINENSYAMPSKTTEKIQYVKPCGTTTFFDVIKNKISLEEFVSSLSPEVMARIVCGAEGENRIESENRFGFNFKPDKRRVEVSSRTTSQFENTLGIPGVTFADGPSGLRIEDEPCTCFPSPSNMGQTWDMSAMVRMGRAYGREMEFYDIDYALAPAMNITRNPMRSRAYEFYTEDPTLAGVMGAGFVMGIKRYEGRDVIMKNLATYNQESNSTDVSINVSNRAFGEIYLRPFSACYFMSRPAGALNSGNKLNGEYTSSQRGINTDILRSDWGLIGFVLSDWGSLSEKAYDIHAGCDLIMPGFDPDKILEAMMDTPPKFNRDGYVEVVETAYVFGTPMIRYENWGSFMPDKDGKDLIQTIVPAGVTLNEKVMKMQEEGICEVTESGNGNRVVTYKGIDRGAYLSLGDLQQATIHILTVIKNSAAMKKLMDRANI